MIRIVSDSASNLYTLDGFDYKCVPMKIVTEKAQYVDEPGLDVSAMLDEIAQTKGRSGSSCPNVDEWLGAFEGADEVIAVAISSNMSGSYNAAHLAAEQYMQEHPGAKVYAVDTLSAGPGLHMVIDQLCDSIRAGLSFEEVVAAHQAYLPTVRMLFVLKSFHNLAANGRVNPAVAALCGMLNIRLLSAASETGTVKVLHKCRGDKKLLATLQKEIIDSGFDGKRLRITHIQNEEMANTVADFARSIAPDCDIQIVPATALCGFYAERGGIMLSYATK
ncbi:MAG: DegV family protein [Clostridia bacterium]|nr:DegV family protein [Clostridia bacterium]